MYSFICIFQKIRAARTWLKLTIFKMNSPVKNVLNSFCRRIYTPLILPRSRRHLHAFATPVQRTPTALPGPNLNQQQNVRLSSSNFREQVRGRTGTT